MRAWKTHVVYLMLASMALQTLAASRAPADHFFGQLWRLEEEKWYDGKEPENMCKDDAIQELAMNIDWLEHHIDTYGSIVAKQPDVWGEARLTKHRDEYERMMYERLNQFEISINASISQSDSSFLAEAFALSAAVDDKSKPATTTTTVAVDSKSATSSSAGVTAATVSAPDAIPSTIGPTLPTGAVSLEPTIFLDQLSRYLQHLHELRRINEGDDTSDSPGYAMNLVRIPVSMLPGKLTRQGFGAEVTITGTPVLSDDLLPSTFRNLVVNDLVDQLGLPLVKTIENVDIAQWKAQRQDAAKFKRFIETITEWTFSDDVDDRRELQKLVQPVTDSSYIRNAIVNAIEDELQNPDSDWGAISVMIANPDTRKKVIDAHNAQSAPKSYSSEFAAAEFVEFVLSMVRHRNTGDPGDLESAKKSLIEAIVAFGEAKSLLATENARLIAERRELLKKGSQLQEHRQHLESQAQPTQELMNGLKVESDSLINESNLLQSQENALAARGAALSTALGAVDNALDKALGEGQSLADRLSRSMENSASSSAVNISGRARRASQPIPPSQVFAVFGGNLFYESVDFFCSAYRGRQIRWAGDPYCSTVDEQGKKIKPPDEYRVDLLDVQKWLGAELAQSHELLSQPNHLQLWYDLANPRSGLAVAIRSEHLHKRSSSTPTVASAAAVSRAAYEEVPQGPFFEGQVIPDGELPRSDFPYSVGALTNDLGTNASVDEYRQYFFDHVHNPYPVQPGNSERAAAPQHIEVLEHLAWAIVVESALLNHRLNEDVRKVAVAKGCGCLATDQPDLSYFLPEAAAKPESGLAGEYLTATKSFQEYVKCRWPIHVFAIDPREQDENVADESLRRRELQFALALGFVSGQINANSLTNYSRELQTEVRTISLNRTIVGFSHGNDTFGWQFYPRVQALDVPGAAGTVWQSIHGVSRDADIRKRQLEPGMRECVAIVLMPSFVPYVDFDVRTNWFKLTNPKNAAITMKDTMKLSRAITAMRNSQAQCAQCAQCYRDGEVQRMMKRVEQLDRELPLQTMRAQIPYENTLGGFEMFNTGITDLAPQLIGWYGAPGVVTSSTDPNELFKCGCYEGCQQSTTGGADVAALTAKVASLEATVKGTSTAPLYKAPLPVCEGQGTTLFLVGDHLSVHDTKVIAGGVCIPDVRLVSRQIMRVTIPSFVNTVSIDGNNYVAIYAATPYGVTNHLHVPVLSRPLTKPTQDAIGKAVDAAVAKQVGALKLAPRDLLLKAARDDQKSLQLEATCTGPAPGAALAIRLKPGTSFPGVIYTIENTAGLLNRNPPVAASFSVAVFAKGSFQGGLIPLPKSVTLANVQGHLFNDIASPEMDAFQSQLNAQVAKCVGLGDLASGKASLKLIFFVNLTCNGECGYATRLVDEFDVEVTMPVPCCCTPDTPAQASAASAAVNPAAAQPTSAGATTTPISAAAAGCGCTLLPATDLPIR